MALVRYKSPQLEDGLAYNKLLLIENMRDPGNLGTLIRLLQAQATMAFFCMGSM